MVCPWLVPAGSDSSSSTLKFRSSEMQTTCDGWRLFLPVCSVVSLHSGMSRAVLEGGCRPSTRSCLDFPPLILFTVCSKLIESAVDDRFYIAPFSALGQTHCARMRFYSSSFFSSFFCAVLNIHRSGILTTLAWLVPHETAALRRVLCTPYKRALCDFCEDDGMCGLTIRKC